MSGGFKVLCCGDLHVCDRPSLGGQRPVTDGGEAVYLAQARRTLAWIAAVAEREGVDAVLVGGDVYEHHNPSPAAEAVVAGWLAALQAVCPVLVLLGNHDCESGGSGPDGGALEPLRYVGDPDLLEVVTTFRLRTVSDRVGYPRLRVAPMPFPPRGHILAAVGMDGVAQANDVISRCLDSIVEGYVAQLDAEAADGTCDLPTLLWGHGTVGGASYGSRSVPLTDPQVSAALFGRFDAAAWSHIHLRQQVGGLGSDAHAYIGAPDRGDFGEEGQEAGVTILTFGARGERARAEFVPNPHARVFATLTPAEALALDVAAETALPAEDRTVWRIRGDAPLAAEAHKEVQNLVRRLRAAGLLISDACDVERTDRARLEEGVVTADTSDAAVLAAVIAADAGLVPHADDITARWAHIRGEV